MVRYARFDDLTPIHTFLLLFLCELVSRNNLSL
jgi:hypothetical protein